MIGIGYRQAVAVAAKELHDRLRNQQVLTVAVVFAVFSFVISYFDSAEQGTLGPCSIELVIISLVGLVIYLIPLIALLLGFDATVGERERGSLDPPLALPLTRAELLPGKYLGLAVVPTPSTLDGFTSMVALLWHQFSSAGLYQAAGSVLSLVLLGLVFLSLALFIFVVGRKCICASGAAIALQFGSVLIFDLSLLGLLVVIGDSFGGQAPAYLLLLNPTDIFRTLSMFSLGRLRGPHGLVSIVPPALGNPWVIGAAMLAWVAASLALATRRFRA